MKYYVSVTDLHRALVDGIRDENAIVVDFPKRGSRRQKLASLPHLTGNLVRVLFDRDAHVFISHPFSVVTAVFSAFAGRLSLFDDGTAYYGRPALPSGRREALDRFLTRKKFDWKALSELEAPVFVDLLRHSSAEDFHAMFPDLLPDVPIRVVPIDLLKAFDARKGNGMNTEPVVVFLDTREDARPPVPTQAVLAILKSEAEQSTEGRIYFKPHPSDDSSLSITLRSAPWATEILGPLEPQLDTLSIKRVYSFHSSGALSIKLAQPEAEIVNIASRAQPVDASISRIFHSLHATETDLP